MATGINLMDILNKAGIVLAPDSMQAISEENVEQTMEVVEESIPASTQPTQEVYQMSLIEEVRKYPCVWDTRTRAFKNSVMKKEAWNVISASLNVDGK